MSFSTLFSFLYFSSSLFSSIQTYPYVSQWHALKNSTSFWLYFLIHAFKIPLFVAMMPCKSLPWPMFCWVQVGTKVQPTWRGLPFQLKRTSISTWNRKYVETSKSRLINNFFKKKERKKRRHKTRCFSSLSKHIPYVAYPNIYYMFLEVWGGRIEYIKGMCVVC